MRVNSPNSVSATQVAPTGFTVTTVGSNFVIFTANANNQLAGGGTTLQPNPILFIVDRGNNGSGAVTVQIDPGCGGTGRTLSGTAT